ncbi:4'-phosphopantetheinyl transferase family protein [Streptacidiphilus monticola]|uniref:4'-phosphopantetheinyl transferase family protein n=1 Tax=Streptacidiphilus monticola TaxID=2161674 RepID=A0ABW1FWM2_9ACTN
MHTTAERRGAPSAGSDLPSPGHRPPRGTAEVWSLRPDPGQVAAAEELGHLLDPAERDRVARCGDESGRASLLASHVALRLLLGAYLGCAPDRVPIEHANCRGCGRRHGRPVVPARPPLHFSLSHTSGLAVVAFAATPVGADVETLASVPGTDLVPLLHPVEQRAIRALPADLQARAFLHCFVRKEAYLKGTGDGLWAELDSFCVGLGPAYETVGDRASGAGTEPEDWAFAEIATPQTHGGAVALHLPGWEERGPRVRVRLRTVDLPLWASRQL